MNDSLIQSVAVMGTVVTVHVVGHGMSPGDRREREDVVARALSWFNDVNDCCSRFDPASELSRLCARVGERVPVSPMLFEALQFALAVAEETDGAFDPTIGARMEARGFDREFRSGNVVRLAAGTGATVSHRDIGLDDADRTVSLRTSLVLDLGAVAKGMAIDLAARELAPWRDFAIDAGGDLYMGGRNAAGEPWRVGIRNPRDGERVLETVCVSDRAVCTSGDYERLSPDDGEHHIMDPRDGSTASAVASATVVAPSAMLADALSTAAVVLGPIDGLALVRRHGLEGLIVTPALERFATEGWHGER